MRLDRDRTIDSSTATADAEFRACAGRTIVEKLDRLVAAVDRVRSVEDPEAIRDLRVASRRLRSTLQLFRPLYGCSEYGRLVKAIGEVTRSLGRARDLDVHITELTREAAAMPAAQRGILLGLVHRLTTERQTAQMRVEAALERITRFDPMARFSRICTIQAARPTAISKADHVKHMAIPPHRVSVDPVGYPIAGLIAERVRDLIRWERFLKDPSRVSELHSMRIAVKRLRYSLEVYGAAAGDRAAEAQGHLKRLQDILGAIHDLDVIVPILSGALRVALRPGQRAGRWQKVDYSSIAGVAGLCERKLNHRTCLLADLKNEWRSMRRQGFVDTLRAA